MATRPRESSSTQPKGPSAAGEDRWREILDAAAEVFAEDGFRAATVSKVGQRAGILGASLYHYIESKDDLLAALVDRAYEQGLEVVREQKALSDLPADERLEAFIARWMQHLEESNYWPGMLARESRWLSEDDILRVEKLRKALRRFLIDLVKTGVTEGTFRDDIDPALVATTIFQLMNYTHLWYSPGGLVSLPDVVTWYQSLFAARLVA